MPLLNARYLTQALLTARRYAKGLVPTSVSQNKYIAPTLFGLSAAAPIVGYEAEKYRKKHDDETDIHHAKTAVARALDKDASLAAVLATEVAEQTLLRGLNSLRGTMRDAKQRAVAAPPGTPKPSFRTASQNESREEGEDAADTLSPMPARKSMP